MKWYLAQMISTKSVEKNLEAVRAHMRDAAEQGCDAVQLPEMFAIFGTSDNAFVADHESEFQGPVGRPLREMARNYGLWIVAGTVPVRLAGETKPRARMHVLDADGEVRTHYDKVHLFDASVSDAQSNYRESEHFQAGDDVVTLDTPWGHWGLSVCYDLRFPELYRLQRDRGVDTFVIPSAFTWSTGRAHWEVLCRARAIENTCYLVAAQQGGQHDEKRRTWGHSLLADPWGEAVQVTEGETGLVVETRLDKVEKLRKRMPTQEHKRF